VSASTIRDYSAIVHTVSNRSTAVGNQNEPTEITGENATTGRIERKTITIAATGDTGGGDQVLIWDGTAAGAIRDWSALSLQVLNSSDGTLELYWMVDTPTSESDLTASGSNAKVIPDSISCAVQRKWDNPRIWMHGTNNTTMGLTAGEPTLFTSSNNALYKRYKLWAWNREDAAVDVEFAVMD